MDMFNQPTNKKIRPIYEHLNKALKPEEKIKNGEKYRQFMYKGIKVDLFMVSSEEFGRILAIRTGPFDYSRAVIATAWRKIGWVGTPQGLRKQYECEEVGENKWKCIVSNPQKPPAFHTEELFYEFLRLNYISPEARGKIKQAA
jgi:DNA polymerase/3'-5' exonuclease PolX